MKLWSLLVGAIIAPQAVASPFSSYHIGNSLTNDARPDGVALVSASAGIDHQVGYHMRSGSSLRAIWEEEASTTSEHGVLFDALPNYAWDAIILQPHGGSTMGWDESTIANMLALVPADHNPDIYIYATWPHQNHGTYEEAWNETTINDPGQPVRRARTYYYDLIDNLRLTHGDRPINLIPVGEVFYEIDRRLRSGELVIDGLDGAHGFYRDAAHLEPEGRYVSALTHFAVLHKQNPELVLHEAAGRDYESDLLTQEVQASLKDIVWQTVNDETYTGVPEPTSAAIIGTGGLLLVLRRRRGVNRDLNASYRSKA